jgi:hypothetical protein
MLALVLDINFVMYPHFLLYYLSNQLSQFLNAILIVKDISISTYWF